MKCVHDENEKFAEEFRKKRVQKRHAQSDAAVALCVSEITIRAWEKGRSVPSRKMYGVVADYCGVDYQDSSRKPRPTQSSVG